MYIFVDQRRFRNLYCNSDIIKLGMEVESIEKLKGNLCQGCPNQVTQER